MTNQQLILNIATIYTSISSTILHFLTPIGGVMVG